MQQQWRAPDQQVVLDHINRDLLGRLAATGGKPPIDTLTLDEARQGLLHMQSVPVRTPDAHVEDRTVNVGSRTLRLRTIRPRQASDHGRVIVYFHGGGWVLGDATTHDRLVKELAVGAEAAVVFVEYSRAPEHRYPAAVEEAYAATCYVHEHAGELGGDATRLAVAGDSVGGNMATVVALLARQRSGPAITGQLLFYPVADAGFETASYEQFADGPWLTRRAMRWFWDQYLPDHARRAEPTASPLQATLEQLSGLPRTLIVTAENDVLRDEGEAYGRKLIQAGVEAVTTRYNATIHDFVMLNPLAEAAPTRAAVAQGVAFLRSLA